MMTERDPKINITEVAIDSDSERTEQGYSVPYPYGMESQPTHTFKKLEKEMLIAPPEPPTEEFDVPDRERDDELQLEGLTEVVPDKNALFTQLITENTVITPLLHTVHDISKELQSTSRASIPHTTLNDLGLTDNAILQSMQALPVTINGVSATLPELLNGGYELDSTPAQPMFSVKKGKDLAPTHISIEGDQVTAQHSTNTRATVGRAFGPHAVNVFTDAWADAQDAFQKIKKDEKKRMFYVAPKEGPSLSEKDMFTGIENVFLNLHAYMQTVDPEEMVDIDLDPLISPWINSVSTRFPQDTEYRFNPYRKSLLQNVKKCIPSQPEWQPTNAREHLRIISNDELFRLKSFTHVTPHFYDPRYTSGITDLMLDYVDKWSQHMYKDDCMASLQNSRKFPKKVFINTRYNNSFTIAPVVTDPDFGYYYDIAI